MFSVAPISSLQRTDLISSRSKTVLYTSRTCIKLRYRFASICSVEWVLSELILDLFSNRTTIEGSYVAYRKSYHHCCCELWWNSLAFCEHVCICLFHSRVHWLFELFVAQIDWLVILFFSNISKVFLNSFKLNVSLREKLCQNLRMIHVEGM